MFKQFQVVMIGLAIGVGILSFPSAALAIQMNIVNDGKDYVGQIIVVIDPTLHPVQHCGAQLEEFRAVILGLGAGEPAMLTAVAVEFGPNAQPGNRYTIDSQTVCSVGRRLWLEATRISRGSASVLFSAPGDLALDADHLGVVTGQADADGAVPVLFKKPGQKPVMASIFSDLNLLPADVLGDIIELDVDPDTGSVLYGAYLEY